MNAPQKTWGILVAGGSGNRYGTSNSKLLETLHGKPVLQWSVEALLAANCLSGLTIVSHPQWESTYQELLTSFSSQIELLWTTGGETRRDSVYQGLLKLPLDTTHVLIHDAARPLVNPQRIQHCLKTLLSENCLGVSLAIPVYHTIKQASSNGMVIQTLDRQSLWQVHTPQIFEKQVLLKAHQECPQNFAINDDAELVERLMAPAAVIKMVEDDPSNIKLTTPADKLIAEGLLETALSKQ